MTEPRHREERATIKVLIVDDSATARLALRQALGSDRSLSIVAEASSGREALTLIAKHAPDIVTMDVYLRGENGIEVTAEIMSSAPRPILIITGSADDPELGYRAIAAGALEVTGKLPSSGSEAYEPARQRLVRLLKALSGVPVVQRRARRRHADAGAAPPPARTSIPGRPSARGTAATAAATAAPTFALKSASNAALGSALNSPLSSAPPSTRTTATTSASATASPPRAPMLADQPIRPRALLIGASTGGPPVVAGILKALRPPLSIPVIIAQHMCSGFSKGFANWLAESTGHKVVLVDDEQPLIAGQVFIPADECHLVFSTPSLLVADKNLVTAGFDRPSIDALFESAAAQLGGAALAIVLTGMGRDGTRGMQALRRLGAFTIAQDPESCTVSSMPRHAIDADAITVVSTPEEIPAVVIARMAP